MDIEPARSQRRWLARSHFFFASGALAVLMIVNLLLLRVRHPKSEGLPAPEVNPRNVYAQKGARKQEIHGVQAGATAEKGDERRQ